tara:strand:- start:175 stop:426 length:252 start_codon:yes stop_codon:yes gene_type:complete
MFLSIYYFFKGIKPMNHNQNINYTLAHIISTGDPENAKIAQEKFDEILFEYGIKYIQKTGFMPARLQRKMLKEHQIEEGNMGN